MFLAWRGGKMTAGYLAGMVKGSGSVISGYGGRVDIVGSGGIARLHMCDRYQVGGRELFAWARALGGPEPYCWQPTAIKKENGRGLLNYNAFGRNRRQTPYLRGPVGIYPLKNRGQTVGVVGNGPDIRRGEIK